MRKNIVVFALLMLFASSYNTFAEESIKSKYRKKAPGIQEKQEQVVDPKEEDQDRLIAQFNEATIPKHLAIQSIYDIYINDKIAEDITKIVKYYDTIEINKVIVPQHFVTQNTYEMYTLEEITEDMKRIVEYYDIAEIEDVGYSFEGRLINSIKVSVPSEKNVDKPKILLMGNIHGREDFSSKQVMHELDHILYSYYTEDGMYGPYNVKDILKKVDIYFLPVINPDGLNIAHKGIKASSNYAYLKTITNISGDYSWWKANGRGVDLNANFEDGNWGIKYIPNSSSRVPASEGYKGDSPNSEPETQAIQAYCEKNLFTLAISYHSSGDKFFWADKQTHGVFDGFDRKIINKMQQISGYTKGSVSQNPAVFGAGFENWFKKRFYRFAICVELSNHPGRRYIQHGDDKFDDLVWKKSKYFGVQLALEAIDVYPHMYDVYQGNGFLKTFYSLEKAIDYASQYVNSRVVNQGQVIWNEK